MNLEFKCMKIKDPNINAVIDKMDQDLLSMLKEDALLNKIKRTNMLVVV